MELLEEKLSSNTLSQFRLLGGKLSSDTQHQRDLLERQKEIERLSNVVENLSRRKFSLQQKVLDLSDPFFILRDDGICTTSRMQHSNIVQKAAVHERERRLSYLVSIQRLSGVTAEVAEEGRVRVNYETCYKGEYFEPYYLVLNLQKARIKVCWHTLPDFIPLDSVVEKYNTGEIQFQSMVHAIQTYLTAFVKRRQQALEFSSRYPEYLKEDIAASHTFNTIQLILEIPINQKDLFQLVVQLYYKDLQSIFPSSVKCSDTAYLPANKSRIKEAFMTLPIAGAFQNLFLDQNIEQG